MLKSEFEMLVSTDIKFEISEELYKKIETVYMWHPSISDTKGKEQIAYLYINFGMQVIEDMLPRAEKIRDIENRISDLKTMIRDAEIEKNKISEVNK